MTSREGVLAVLRHRPADRVPVAEMWIDPVVARALAPGARDANDAVQALDLDMVSATHECGQPMFLAPSLRLTA